MGVLQPQTLPVHIPVEFRWHILLWLSMPNIISMDFCSCFSFLFYLIRLVTWQLYCLCTRLMSALCSMHSFIHLCAMLSFYSSFYFLCFSFVITTCHMFCFHSATAVWLPHDYLLFHFMDMLDACYYLMLSYTSLCWDTIGRSNTYMYIHT